jgi:hypothetical protein
MKTSALLAISLLLILIPLASADEDTVELEISTSRDTYRDAETVSISGSVENTHPNTDVSGIEISVSGNGELTVSGEETVSIEADSKKGFEITLSGEITQKYDITITAESSDENIVGDSVDVDVLPPELELKIISPKEEITWAVEHVENNTEIDFDVMVENTGGSEIPEVSITIDTHDMISCNLGEGDKNIPKGKTVKFPVSCSNVSNGDRVTINAADQNNEAHDIESVEFYFVEKAKNIELQINSPVENEELRINDLGGEINIDVENTGEVDLKGVCPIIEGLQSIPAECKDLAVGEDKSFSVEVLPERNLTNARIFVTDEEARAEDEVMVRVLRIKRIIPEKNVTQTNDTQEETQEEAQNESTDDADTSDEEVEGGGFELPSEFFIILAIAIPLIVLLVYIRMTISRVGS